MRDFDMSPPSPDSDAEVYLLVESRLCFEKSNHPYQIQKFNTSHMNCEHKFTPPDSEMPVLNSSVASPASTSSQQSSDSMPVRRKIRVSAQHTLDRVRENQRRHRARQRDYVVVLEQKLDKTEKLLEEARDEIRALKAEQAAARAICQLATPKRTELGSDFRTEDVPSDMEEDYLNQHSTREPEYLNDQLPPLSFPDTTTTTPPSPFTLLGTLPSTPLEPIITGPPPCCSDPPSTPTPPTQPLDPQCPNCKTRPAPDPSESTTLCAQAFIMISQQNFRDVDPQTIRVWLAEGLRRARSEGEGCRVENGALWRLLDYISGL